MWPDRVSDPVPLSYKSGALPTALHGPAFRFEAVCIYTESMYRKKEPGRALLPVLTGL